ncbi:hypothetical protein Bca101_049047 [Brassica carinata]
MMGFSVSDELLGTVAPIVVYWLYSGIYVALSSLERYRLHSKAEEEEKNLVSKSAVVKGVLLQQVVQAAVAILLFTILKCYSGSEKNKGKSRSDVIIYESASWILGLALSYHEFLVWFCILFSVTLLKHPLSTQVTGSDAEADIAQQFSLLVLTRQFIIAMIILDTWQYFMHRYMHHNKFLYKHIHSQHHRLVVPYAYGALYNHPVEGLLLDTVGGALSFLISGMSPRTSIFFFSFATIKTVDDHCGLCLPGNLFHMVFKNNSAYHDVHHQLYGSKYNFSQPFFSVWDRILGTYMPYSLEKREGGGFEARPTKEFKDD